MSDIQPTDSMDASQMSYRDQQALLADMDKKFTSCANARTPFDRQWYMNLSFFFGKQYVQWVGNSTTGGKLYEPPAPSWRVRLAINKIRPTIRRELTKLTKENIQYFVVPNSTEDDDLAAARAAELIAEYLFDECKFNQKRRSVMFWTLLCGTGFIKTYFDMARKDSSGVDGSVVLEPVNAFHLYVPDLQTETIEDQEYVFHAMAKSPEWVEMVYGQKVEPDASINGTQLEQKLMTALGVNNATGGSKVTYVKEAWFKPCRKYPEGAVITFANQKLLSYTPYLPYEHQQFPFAKIDHIPAGRFYGSSTIEDLIPLQKEYNRTRSQLTEAKNRMAKPQLMAPKGSIDPNKITSEPGLIIQYTPGFTPPTPLQLPSIPQYVIEELDRTGKDMSDIHSQDQPSQKTSAYPGVEAATAIAYLSEQNDTILAHTVASMEEAIQTVGKQMLTLVGQYWDQQRTIRVVGKNASFEAEKFSNADLRGNTDFRIESGSAAPRSRAAKQAFLTEIGKMGWISPDKVLRHLDMVETNKLYEETQVDQREAQRENDRMKNGQQVPVQPWQNNELHKEVHELFMKSEEFEMLDPQVQQIFIQHWQETDQMIQQKQMQEMQQQQMGQPQQGEAPQPDQGMAQ